MRYCGEFFIVDGVEGIFDFVFFYYVVIFCIVGIVVNVLDVVRSVM